MVTELKKMTIKLYDPSVVYGKRIAVVGRLGGMSRRDFSELLSNNGGQLVDREDKQIDLIVRGAETSQSNPVEKNSVRPNVSIEVMEETRLWEALGFVDPETETGRLYTPAMLADLLGIAVSTIRRWSRRGLIHPVRQFKKLDYFDFEEVASARRIARLIADGKSPAAIESQLVKIANSNGPSRTLSQLSVIVEGKQLLLRQGDGLIEPGGQKVFEFEPDEPVLESNSRSTISLDQHQQENFGEDSDVDGIETDDPFTLSSDGASICAFRRPEDPAELIELAIELEDEGDLQSSIEVYRSLALECGGRADFSFRLAELLYQNGELGAARERYFSAVELDPNFVEARASLGCILVELGESELAISAFHGALDQHPDYPDVHFHLAKLLDELGRHETARTHWEAFLELAPKSPWADQARTALERDRERDE
jgi:tetratricopeptide (TPR) repeat protein